MIKKVVNIYIVYEITASSPNNADPTLTNSLFGAVRLTKNADIADIEKYQYSGYGTGFDRFFISRWWTWQQLPSFQGGLKISDQNNWGRTEQKVKFGGGGAKFKGGPKILGGGGL